VGSFCNQPIAAAQIGWLQNEPAHFLQNEPAYLVQNEIGCLLQNEIAHLNASWHKMLRVFRDFSKNMPLPEDVCVLCSSMQNLSKKIFSVLFFQL